MKTKRTIKALLLSLVILFLLPCVVSAQTWQFYFPITVVDESGIVRTQYPVGLGASGQNLIDGGYVTANGTNTRMRIGTTDVPYLLATNNITVAVPSLSAYGQQTFSLYTGYSPDIDAFDIVVGDGGSANITDDATLELANNFEIDLKGYVDTGAGANKTLLYKRDAFQLYISAAGDITAAISVPASISPYSSTEDGFLEYSDAVYATAHDAAAAEVETTTSIRLGQQKPADFELYRSYVYFDTSALPDDATITSATLKLYGSADASTTDFLITIQNGQPARPADPLTTADWDRTFYSGDGGSLTTVGFSTVAYNDIALNATGLTWVNKTGTTKFCIRSSREINADVPAGAEYVACYSVEEAGVNKDPQLVVNYLSETTATATGITSGIRRIIVSADGANLVISVYDDDDVLIDSDTTALAGASVADNTNIWTFATSNTTPYLEYYHHTVSGVEHAWYQPNYMVQGTTLIDRSHYALDYDGTDDNVDYGADALLDITDKATIEAWVYIDSDGENNEGSIVDRRDATPDGYRLYVSSEAAGLVALEAIMDCAVLDAHAISQVVVTVGEWHYVVAVYDRLGTNHWEIYSDGVLLTLTTDDDGQGAITGHTANVFYTGDNSASNRCFDGRIDEVRFYQRAFDQAEVTSNYNNSAGVYTPTSNTSMQGEWHTEDGSGATSTDTSGNGFDGTITNAVWINGKVQRASGNSGTNDGVIIWGANDEISIAFGEMVSFESTASTASADETGFNLPSVGIPTNWWGLGFDGTDLPFHATFLDVSNQTGIPEQTLYIWLLFGVAVALAVATITLTKSVLVGVAFFSAVMVYGANATIVAWWIVFVYLILIAGLMFLTKRAGMGT